VPLRPPAPRPWALPAPSAPRPRGPPALPGRPPSCGAAPPPSAMLGLRLFVCFCLNSDLFHVWFENFQTQKSKKLGRIWCPCPQPTMLWAGSSVYRVPPSPGPGPTRLLLGAGVGGPRETQPGCVAEEGLGAPPGQAGLGRVPRTVLKTLGPGGRAVGTGQAAGQFAGGTREQQGGGSGMRAAGCSKEGP